MTSRLRLSTSPVGSPANRKHFYDNAPLIKGKSALTSYNKWLFMDTSSEPKMKWDGVDLKPDGGGDGVSWLTPLKGKGKGKGKEIQRRALTPKTNSINRKENTKIEDKELKEETDLTLKVEVLGSYNWDTSDWRASIVVPGAPKKFRSSVVGSRLREQDKQMLVDEDSYRCPQAPLEPLLIAVKLLSPKFDFNQMDIVGDLTCIKRLARFLLMNDPTESHVEYGGMKNTHDNQPNSPTQRDNKSSFRIDAQMMYPQSGCKSVAFMRRENSHYIRWYGFGAGAVQACQIIPDNPTLHGPHKQICKVNIGSLNLLLRHKVLMADYDPNIEIGGDIEKVIGGSVQVKVAGIDPKQADSVLICSLSSKRLVMSVDKWIEMLITNTSKLYLGKVVSASWIGISDVQAMCNVKDAQRLIKRLELLLTSIVEMVRTGDASPGYALINGGGGEPASLHMYPVTKTDHRPASHALLSSIFNETREFKE